MRIDMNKKAINGLNAVLAEQGKTNKWLAEKLNKHEKTEFTSYALRMTIYE